MSFIPKGGALIEQLVARLMGKEYERPDGKKGKVGDANFPRAYLEKMRLIWPREDGKSIYAYIEKGVISFVDITIRRQITVWQEEVKNRYKKDKEKNKGSGKIKAE